LSIVIIYCPYLGIGYTEFRLETAWRTGMKRDDESGRIKETGFEDER
jgi:hypothetical protein